MPVGEKSSFDLLYGPWIFSLEKTFGGLLNGFLRLPPVHLFRAGVPEKDAAIEVADQYRRKIKDSCLLLQSFF